MREDFSAAHDKYSIIDIESKNDHTPGKINMIIKHILTILKRSENPEIKKIANDIAIQQIKLSIDIGPTPSRPKDKRLVNDEIRKVHFNISQLLNDVYDHL